MKKESRKISNIFKNYLQKNNNKINIDNNSFKRKDPLMMSRKNLRKNIKKN